jgi:hypothetical protein
MHVCMYEGWIWLGGGGGGGDLAIQQTQKVTQKDNISDTIN